MPDRIYCGNGKEKRFPDGGSIVTITVDLDTLIREFPNYGFTTDAGKRKIRLKVGQRREVDQYGNSHLVEVDTYKPTSKPGGQGGAQQGQGGRNSPMSPTPFPRPSSGTARPSPEPEGDEGFADDVPW